MSKTSHVGTHSPDSVARPSANPTSSAPAAASREEEPPLSGILDPVELINQIRQLPPSKWPHGVPQEVQAKLLRWRRPTRCTFEIRILTEGQSHQLIGKFYPKLGEDMYAVMEELWRAGFSRDAENSIAQPIAYLPSMRLLLQEKVEGLGAKEVGDRLGNGVLSVPAETGAPELF